MTSKWTFQAEPGYFQDLAAVENQAPGTKITTQPQLALLPRKYPTDSADAEDQRNWVRFAAHVVSLNEDAPDNVAYKVLYLTRHGLGYHNKKHIEVGTAEWDRYWSLLDGDESSTWFDSFLTDAGIQQARDLITFWMHTVDTDGAPLPQVIYTSPLARCLQTSFYVFSTLMESHDIEFNPLVKKKLRERFTLHTCDKRRPRAWMKENYSTYSIEEGFTEKDPFGARDWEESDNEHMARKQAALGEIFSSDTHEFIALTVHWFAIRSILLACNAKPIRVRQGSSIAILVRGERLEKA